MADKVNSNLYFSPHFNPNIMAKIFSVASWNVEHFKGSSDHEYEKRRAQVINFLNQQNPDIIGIYEVEGKEVFHDLTQVMPGYNFHITEGPQVQEILVGVRNNISSFFTQKIEFKSGVTVLRPGALLTITINNSSYPILFLHAKSSNDPRSYGLRDDIINKSLKFTNVLEDIANGDLVNFIIVGDLNTMGMIMKNLRVKDIEAEQEIERIEERARRYYDLSLLPKTSDLTWSNGSSSSLPDSNLDHVIAAEHLKFKKFEKNGQEGFVDVRGWIDESSIAAKDQWIHDFSDHNLLYFEVVD